MGIKGWHKQASASAIQVDKHVPLALAAKGSSGEQACIDMDLQHRMQVQNKLAAICEDMCKEVGAYPKCAQCPKFVAPDSTPGVTTWDELLEHMDNLVLWGQGMIKGWHQQAPASAIQVDKHVPLALAAKGSSGEQACIDMDL